MTTTSHTANFQNSNSAPSLWDAMRTPEKRAELWTAASSAAAGFAFVSGVRAVTGLGAVALGLSATFTLAATGGAAILAGAALAHHHRNKQARLAGKEPVSFFSRETGKTIAKGLATTTALGVVAATGISGAFLAVAGVALISTTGALYDLSKAIRKGEVKTAQDGFSALGKNLRRRSFWSLMGAGAAVLVGEAVQHLATAPAQHAAAPAAAPAPIHSASGVVAPAADPLPEVTANLKTLADIEQKLAHPGSPAASQPAAAASAVNVAAPAHVTPPVAAAPVNHAPAPQAVAVAPAPVAAHHHVAAAPAQEPAPVIHRMPADLPTVKLSPQEPIAPLAPVNLDAPKLADLPAINLPATAEAAPVAEMAEMTEQPAAPAPAAVEQSAAPAPATEAAPPVAPAPVAQEQAAAAPLAQPVPQQAEAPVHAVHGNVGDGTKQAISPQQAAPVNNTPTGEFAGRCELRENFQSSFDERSFPAQAEDPKADVTTSFRMQCEFTKPVMNTGDWVETYVKTDVGGIKEIEARTVVTYGQRLTEQFARHQVVGEVMFKVGELLHPGRNFVPTIN